MEPFAYKKSKQPDLRKRLLLLLAGASFSIWYFDLVPELSPVSTGDLGVDITDPQLGEADFLSLLESPPADAQSGLVSTATAELPEEDPLLAALAAQSDPIEDSFPEFSDSTPEANPSAAVQRVSFEQTQPPEVRFEPPPPVLPADVAAHLRDVDEWMKAGETLEAHAALSRLYWKQPELRMYLQERLQQTAAEIYANPKVHFAPPRMVEFGETLEGIAKEYEVPWMYLANLNGVTAQTLQAGQNLKVLKGPFGVVVDLKRFLLTVHAHGWYVHHYRIGIGQDNRTPVGEFTVKTKLENPTWYNPSGGVVDADDPTNPLGEYWIGLGDHIGIHGTIDPDSIGTARSRGCIHLGDDDIAEVFQLLSPGSPVVIRN